MESMYPRIDESTLPQFGNYRTSKFLGGSPRSPAHTYLVEDVTLKRHLVIKQINPALVRQDTRYLQYFQQEAQMLAKLKHPHIVEIWGYHVEETDAYIVMPYVEGGTLRKLLQDHGGSMTPQEVLPIFEQLTDGLAYAHDQSDATNPERKGILHLDLKPENILVEEIKARFGWFNRVETQEEKQRHYWIADFGIARWMNQKTGIPDGQSWFGAGTAGYCAREQYLVGSGDVTVKSDIFSLGVMVHEMLSGKRPPKEPREALRPLRELSKTISPEVEAVIQQATHPDSSERYESVVGFLNDFKRAMEARPEIASNLTNSSHPTRSLPLRPPEKKTRLTNVGRSLMNRIPPLALRGYVLVVLLLLLVVIIGTIALNHPAAAQPQQAPLTRMGGLAFDSYCQGLGYGEVTNDDSFCFAPIDLTAACRWSYPSQGNAIAKNENPTNSQTWNCYTPQNVKIGDISGMNGYCQYQYHYGIPQAAPQENGTNGWICEQKVTPIIVCIWQYDRIDVQAHMDEGLWYCYGPSR